MSIIQNRSDSFALKNDSLVQRIGFNQLVRLIKPPGLLPIIIFLGLLVSNGFSANIYVAENTLGAGTGADPADAISVATMNAGQAAGTVYYLVGTITSTIGVFANNVTVNFMANASITRPNGEAIYMNNVSGAVINGGVNGIIQNTATGTGLTYSNAATFIDASGSSGSTFENLSFLNQYVHTSINDVNANIAACGGIYANGFGGSNNIVSCLFSNVGWCINIQSTSANFLLVSNCAFYNYDHGVVPNGFTNIAILNNHFDTTANWDTKANAYHHDPIHYFSSFINLQSFVIAGNVFTNNLGNNNTAMIYLETNPRNVLIYSNLFLQYPSNCINDGMVYAVGPTNDICNNTFLGSGVYNSSGLTAGGRGSIVENNLFNDLNTFVSVPNTVVPRFANNLYANQAPGGNPPWGTNGAAFTTLTQWQGAVGDANSAYTAASTGVVNPDGTIPPGSPAIGAGANLSSILTTGLLGSLHSTVDVGAYQVSTPGSTSGTTAPSTIVVTPPVESFGVVPIGITTNEILTVQNTSSGVVTGGVTATLPYNIVSGGSYTLTPGQSQAVTISFSPTVVGHDVETVTFSGGTGTNVVLTGVGGQMSAPQNLQSH
jgi:hypothetical protein